MNGITRPRPQTLIAAGIFLLAVLVYFATTSPTISFWDCGEFVTTSHILGIPHQPGTPLYVLMGRCFDILLGSPNIHEPALKTARAVNFMSNLFSALALMFIYLIILGMARRTDPDSGWLAHVGGLVGAFFLMFSTTYWNNAIEAEVYGLAAFMIAFLTWLALRWYDTCEAERSNRLLYMIIYLLGLGVGFHLGTLLVYPGIFVLILLAAKRRLAALDLLVVSAGLALFLLSTISKDNTALLVMLIIYIVTVGLVSAVTRRPFVLAASGLFLLGLSVHLMMLLRAPLNPAINQSQPETFAAMMSVLRREQYPPLDPFKRQAALTWQFGYYYHFFLDQFTFLSKVVPAPGWLRTFGIAKFDIGLITALLGPVFLGILGIVHGLRRARPVIWVLVVNYLINGEILTLYLNFTNHEVRDRDYFYFAAFMFFAVFIGMGVVALLRMVAGQEGKSAGQLAPGEKVAPVTGGVMPRVFAAFLLAIALMPLLVPGNQKWFQHDRSHNLIPREYAWNILAGLDKNAILFTNGDNDTFPVWYLQEVERFRRDVTVVNLSLVNLPWYVKQMRERQPPIPCSFSDEQIDKLRPVALEDPNTGQRRIFLVRDYVVYDIVTTNTRAAKPRPVFFAVTIPQENMELYYPYLQMEGLAYRLLTKKSDDGRPIVDSDRLLANMLGVYDYGATLSGDSSVRRSRYAELAGWKGDAATTGGIVPTSAEIPYADLFPYFGERRRDVYRDDNTENLLGNYPAALVRASFEFLRDSETFFQSDSTRFEELRQKSLATLELARRFDPYFGPVVDLYPLLLVDKGYYEETFSFLDSLQGRVSPADEERSVTETIDYMRRIGQPDLAIEWLNRRIALQPDRKYFYSLLFTINQRLGRLEACQAVLDRWQARTGQVDTQLQAELDKLKAQAGDRP